MSFSDRLRSPEYTEPVSRFLQWVTEHSVSLPGVERDDYPEYWEEFTDTVVEWVNSTPTATVEDFETVTEYASHCGIPYPSTFPHTS